MISSEFATAVWLRIFTIANMLSFTAKDQVNDTIEYSFTQFPILQFYFEEPVCPPTIKTLTRVTGMMPGAVSQAVEQLVEQGLLARVPAEDGRRGCTFLPTEKLLAVREKAVRHFTKMRDAGVAANSVSREELELVDSMMVRLSRARIGGEHNFLKHPSDLTVPGLVMLDESCRTNVQKLPGLMKILHFTSNLRFPILIHYYGKRGRMTLGKLRILNCLFLLTTNKSVPPTVKELAERFRISPGAVSQTLDAMCQDGMVERVPSPLDRRMTHIRLTAQGLRMRRQSASACTKFMRNFLENEPPENVAAFERMLDRVIGFLKTDGREFLSGGEEAWLPENI